MIATDFKERPVVVDKWWKLLAIQRGDMSQIRLPVAWTPYEKGLNLSFSGLDIGLYNTCNPRSGWVLRSRDGRGTWNDRTKPVHCPLGQVGDRLWVKEPHSFVSGSILYEDVKYSDGAVKARKTDAVVAHSDESLPARQMPRWAARAILEITDVRVERLRCISDEGIKATGYTHFEAEAALAPLAKRAKARPQHWLSGDGIDEAISWCRRCAEKEAAKIGKAEKKEIRVDGGYDVQDEDGVRFCEGCGHIVEFHLTEFGMLSYIQEFEKDPVVKNPVDAYELSRYFETDEKHYPEIEQRLRRLGFRVVWDAAHGKKGFAWEKDPWNWIVQFRVVWKG
jgi:hypothetical protein